MGAVQELLFSTRYAYENPPCEITKEVEAPVCVEDRSRFEYRKLDTFSQEYKSQFFDFIYEMCLVHARNALKGERCATDDCDCGHFIYETAIKRCLGPVALAQLNSPECYTMED